MFYVDTSVLVAAVSDETNSEAARNWMQARDAGEMAISQWTITEFSAALSIKQRAGDLSGEQRSIAHNAFSRWLKNVFRVLDVEQADFQDAARMAEQVQAGLRSGDALHAAIALNRDLTLCTLDKGLLKAGSLGVAVDLIGAGGTGERKTRA